MDQKEILKVGVPLSIVGVVILSFFLVGWLMGQPGKRAASVTEEGGSASAERLAGDAAFAELLAAHIGTMRRDLAAAKRAMSGATRGNHGGYVEKSLEDLDAAIASADHVADYVASHPEVSTQAAVVSQEAQAAIDEVNAIVLAQPNNQGHLVDGMAGLKGALEALQQARGGDLGGTRDKLILDISRAAKNIFAGFEYLRTGQDKKAPAKPAQGGN